MAISKGVINLLTPTTSAVASSSFQLTKINKGGAKIKVTALATTEKAYLQERNTAGTFIDYKINGAVPYFDKDSHVIIIDEMGEFRVNKNASAGACGVTLLSHEDVVVY